MFEGPKGTEVVYVLEGCGPSSDFGFIQNIYMTVGVVMAII